MLFLSPNKQWSLYLVYMTVVSVYASCLVYTMGE